LCDKSVNVDRQPLNEQPPYTEHHETLAKQPIRPIGHATAPPPTSSSLTPPPAPSATKAPETNALTEIDAVYDSQAGWKIQPPKDWKRNVDAGVTKWSYEYVFNEKKDQFGVNVEREFEEIFLQVNVLQKFESGEVATLDNWKQAVAKEKAQAQSHEFDVNESGPVPYVTVRMEVRVEDMPHRIAYRMYFQRERNVAFMALYFVHHKAYELYSPLLNRCLDSFRLD